MRLGLTEGWAGRKRKTAVCPKCSSERARYSRRHYDGPWFHLFRVRLVKCSDCGAYFSIAADATIRRPETDPIDLHIPFRPSELDDLEEGPPGEEGDELSRRPRGWRPSRQACPICGSDQVRPSRPGGDLSLIHRLDVRTTYRCTTCNGAFRRTNLLRLLVYSAILLGVLGGLSYAAIRKFGGRGPADNSPRIRNDQVRPPPPPVFR